MLDKVTVLLKIYIPFVMIIPIWWVLSLLEMSSYATKTVTYVLDNKQKFHIKR